MFKVGDAIVHPAFGAGVVTGLKELRYSGNPSQYYQIKLLKRTDTRLMVPVQEVEDRGIRRAISGKLLDRVWLILGQAPQALPDNYKSRHKLLEDKFSAGDIILIAEAVRDAAGRRRKRSLTDRGKRIYRRGLTLLISELAAAQDIGLAEAEAQVRDKLRGATMSLSL